MADELNSLHDVPEIVDLRLCSIYCDGSTSLVSLKHRVVLADAEDLSVSAVCRRLSMSRSQFYFHVKRGTFPAPLRLPSNQRPYYTASMVEDIVWARETGVGVNGEYVLFYERLATAPKGMAKADHSALLEGLRTLGLTSVTTDRIDAAIAVCYPKGTAGQDEANVLRAVFRHLKRSGTV